MLVFTNNANRAIQEKLAELGGRELRSNDERGENEKYAMSVKGRRFIFSDLAAYNRFDEFVMTELQTLCHQYLSHDSITQR